AHPPGLHSSNQISEPRSSSSNSSRPGAATGATDRPTSATKNLQQQQPSRRAAAAARGSRAEAFASAAYAQRSPAVPIAELSRPAAARPAAALLRQRRQLGLGRQQQRRSGFRSRGSYSDNESAAGPMLYSGQQQQRRRGLEGVSCRTRVGCFRGRFASLDRAAASAPLALLSSPTSSSSPSAAERRGREIRQLRRELAEAQAGAPAVCRRGAERQRQAPCRHLSAGWAARQPMRALDSRRLSARRQPGGRLNLLDWPVGVPVSGSGNDKRGRRSCLPSSWTSDTVGHSDADWPAARRRRCRLAGDVAAGARRLLRRICRPRVDPPGGLGLGGRLCGRLPPCRLQGLWRQRRFVDFNSDDALPAAWRPLPRPMAAAASAAASLRLVLRDFNSEGSGGGAASSLDALAFATLGCPKRCCSAYICLLAEHRRLVLCGPTGTGKTFLAGGSPVTMARLERRRSDDDEEADVSGAVAEFSGELPNRSCGPSWPRPQSRKPDPKRPSRGVQVLLLDSLQHLGPLAEARSGLAASRFVHHLHRAEGGLRQLQALDDGGIGVDFVGCCAPTIWSQCEACSVVTFADNAWWPKLPSRRPNRPPSRRGGTNLTTGCPGPGSAVNSFLEARGGGPDATVGPGPLLGCPLDPAASRDWFVSLWNHSLAPRLLAASSMTQSSAEDWEDPADWVMSTWPWPELPPGDGELVRLRSQTAAPDPLMTMLMKLREAAAASGRGEEDNLLATTSGVGTNRGGDPVSASDAAIISSGCRSLDTKSSRSSSLFSPSGVLQRAVWIVVVLVRMLQAVQMVLRRRRRRRRRNAFRCRRLRGGCGGGGGSRWISGLCGRQLCQFRCRCCISVDSMVARCPPRLFALLLPLTGSRLLLFPRRCRRCSCQQRRWRRPIWPPAGVVFRPGDVQIHGEHPGKLAVHVFLIAGNAGRGAVECLADAADVQHNADEQAETFGQPASSPENTNRAPLMKISLMALGSQKLKKVTHAANEQQGQASCREQAGYVKVVCGGGCGEGEANCCTVASQ
uniref:AAA domain-containing protein n=1 Tax=Macrostomum lignano TaxID=282301 RepID=A0A1I8FBD6_9PLAT